MNKNVILWDARRPNLDRWWKNPKNQGDRLPDTVHVSSEAREEAKHWLRQRLDYNETPQRNVSNRVLSSLKSFSDKTRSRVNVNVYNFSVVKCIRPISSDEIEFGT